MRKVPAGRNGAFTLAEILLVVAIMGIVVSAGIVPLLYTGRLLRATREDFATQNAERRVFNRIYQDIRGAADFHASPVIVLKQDSELSSSGRDLLSMWTLTPAYARQTAGNVVYCLADRENNTATAESGLYRWILSEDLKPEDLSSAALKKFDAALLLPDVRGIEFRVQSSGEWKSVYQGAMPTALRVTFEYQDGKNTYECLLPAL